MLQRNNGVTLAVYKKKTAWSVECLSLFIILFYYKLNSFQLTISLFICVIIYTLSDSAFPNRITTSASQCRLVKLCPAIQAELVASRWPYNFWQSALFYHSIYRCAHQRGSIICLQRGCAYDGGGEHYVSCYSITSDGWPGCNCKNAGKHLICHVTNADQLRLFRRTSLAAAQLNCFLFCAPRGFPAWMEKDKNSSDKIGAIKEIIQKPIGKLAKNGIPRWGPRRSVWYSDSFVSHL